ncbi:MAG: hypothetical protein QG670_1900, partial [Thermoproteota archaeon]|nr:hypothetical protein [Thermoproteota archaeon]
MVKMSNGDIRFKEQIGIVTSEASSEQFKFFVTPLTNNLGVGKDDYIIIEYNLYGKPCPLLAVVKDLINYEEVIGTSIRENKSVKTIATGEIIGCVDIRNPEVKILRKISTPPTPGCRVFLPYLEFLEDVFSRTQTGKLLKRPLHIGELLNANSKQGGLKPLNFYLDFENLTNNHMLISAISGHGKTSLASVIVEEIV